MFTATQILWDDAAEFVAFLHVVPVDRAKWIFQWGAAGVREASKLFDYMKDDEDVSELVRQNLVSQTPEDGLAVLRAMQDGGFRVGKVPDIVRMALLDLRDKGFSQPKIAHLVGLTHDQVRIMANGPRRASPAALALWNVTG